MPHWYFICENRTAIFSDISVLVFVCFPGSCFLRFSNFFQGFKVIAIHIRIHHHLSKFFLWVLASGPYTVTSGHLSAMFSTRTQSSSYTTDYSYVK